MVVEKHGEVSIYRHAVDLVRDLEPIDIRNGEYEIYDRSGATVVPMVDKVSQPHEKVVLRPWPGPQAQEVLARALNRALDAVPGAPTQRPAALSELVELAAVELGYSPQPAFFEKWSPLAQYRFFNIVGVAGFVPFGIAALAMGNSWLICGGGIWFLLLFLRAGEVECAGCGRPLYRNFKEIPLIRMYLLPKECSRCGSSLAGPEL